MGHVTVLDKIAGWMSLKGMAAHAAFLDSSDAYNRVPHYGLLIKIHTWFPWGAFENGPSMTEYRKPSG